MDESWLEKAQEQEQATILNGIADARKKSCVAVPIKQCQECSPEKDAVHGKSCPHYAECLSDLVKELKQNGSLV